jgi:hypothetical protein
MPRVWHGKPGDLDEERALRHKLAETGLLTLAEFERLVDLEHSNLVGTRP